MFLEFPVWRPHQSPFISVRLGSQHVFVGAAARCVSKMFAFLVVFRDWRNGSVEQSAYHPLWEALDPIVLHSLPSTGKLWNVAEALLEVLARHLGARLALPDCSAEKACPPLQQLFEPSWPLGKSGDGPPNSRFGPEGQNSNDCALAAIMPRWFLLLCSLEGGLE